MAAYALCAQPNPQKAPAGQRLVNPRSPAARLMLATPEQRERALQRFTPERQAQIRKQLAWFDGLPKPQQAIQIRRLERFARLLPAQRAEIQRQMQALNRLPQNRKQLVRRALSNVLNLSSEMRARRLNNPAFQSRFSPEELSIIRDLSDAWAPGPM
jgi:DNA-directed RNA polymerase beta' subunit